MLTQAEKEYVQANLHADVAKLALKLGRLTHLNPNRVLRQIAGFQAIEHKIPSWYGCSDLIFPQSLSLEQCSSQATAAYKHKIVSTLPSIRSVADLTGGFGVDCSFLAVGKERVLYVERQSELCELAQMNFMALNLLQIEVKLGDGEEVLSTSDAFDLIYLDPARRDSKGGKVVALSDCEPDLTRIKSMLLEKAGYVLIKLSPMLDISLALKTLVETVEVHVVSVDGECKELLFLLQSDKKQPGLEPVIYCVNLRTNGEDQSFLFSKSEELDAVCSYASTPEKYLYEPNASLLKAGAFSILTQSFPIRKLHPNSHLYTSETLIKDFPGRLFAVESFFPFQTKSLKTQLDGVVKANITVRNFPNTVADIRKKTKIREGGDLYLFATTLLEEQKVLIACKKV